MSTHVLNIQELNNEPEKQSNISCKEFEKYKGNVTSL